MPTTPEIRAMADRLEACRDYNGLHWPEARSAATMLRQIADEREAPPLFGQGTPNWVTTHEIVRRDGKR